MQVGCARKRSKSACPDVAILSLWFCHWKDAKASFKRHKESHCHKDSLQAFTIRCLDCGEMLSTAVLEEKATNRQMLYEILSITRYLAQQDLPLRGDGIEIKSNFMQLLLMQGECDPHILEWLKRKSNRYMSPGIQNETLMLMSHQVLREIIMEVHWAIFIQ